MTKSKILLPAFFLGLILLAFTCDLYSEELRLTMDPADDTYPSFSPDGKKIAYISKKGLREVWIMDSDGSNKKHLFEVIISLDGDTFFPTVEFLDNRHRLMVNEIHHLWDILLADLRKATDFPITRTVVNGSDDFFSQLMYVPGQSNASTPAYNDFTGKVAWVSRQKRIDENIFRGQHHIRISDFAELNGQSTKTQGDLLYETVEDALININNRVLSFSPDGKYLAFSGTIESPGDSGRKHDLYIIDAEKGGIVRRLTNDGANGIANRDPCWSPGGEWIAFASNRGGKWDIWAIDPNGTEYMRLTDDKYIDFAPVWSPDGKKIAYTSEREGNKDIYLMDVEMCGPGRFSYPNANSAETIFFAGASENKGNFFRLTGTENYLAGAIWHIMEVPLKKFRADFSFRLSQGDNNGYIDNSEPGADGIAFVVQKHGYGALGIGGYGIGYQGIPNSFAIEFDTYNNNEKQTDNMHDPNGNHIAVQSMRELPNTADHATPANFAIQTDIPLIKADSTIYYVSIDCNVLDEKMRIFLDTTSDFDSPLLELPASYFIQSLKIEEYEYAYVGITAGTGNAWENHDILSFSLCPLYTAGPNPVDDKYAPDNSLLCYPNPFSGRTYIELNMNKPDRVNIFIFDALGRQVKKIHEGPLGAGFHHFVWDAVTHAPGAYFCRAKIGEETFSCGLMLVR